MLRRGELSGMYPECDQKKANSMMFDVNEEKGTCVFEKKYVVDYPIAMVTREWPNPIIHFLG